MNQAVTRRQKFWLALASLQLILVALGAAQVPLEKVPGIGTALSVYSQVSGAESGYGFFSPGVSSQLKATFLVHESKETKQTQLDNIQSNEASLRIGNIVSRFWDATHNAPLRRAFTASWAGKVFAKNPQANAVTVRVDQFDPVSSKEFREGKRARWELFYQAKYEARKRHKQSE